MKRETLTQEVVRSLFLYDPETGVLRWRVRPESNFPDAVSARRWNSQNSGNEAGHIRSSGYRYVTVFGRPYPAHRVIWLHEHGVWPLHTDHQDGVRSNNRLANLRDVTPSQNHKNVRLKETNSSGFVGVSWNGRRKRWLAHIRVDYKQHQLGFFATKDEAVARRKAAEVQYGFHPNHGRAS